MEDKGAYIKQRNSYINFIERKNDNKRSQMIQHSTTMSSGRANEHQLLEMPDEERKHHAHSNSKKKRDVPLNSQS